MDDQFQYAYTNETGDQTVIARVASQDATNPDNKAGILMKESLSNTAHVCFYRTDQFFECCFHL